MLTEPVAAHHAPAAAHPALVDAHVHLDAYDDRAIDAMLDRAWHAGVWQVLAIAGRPAAAQRTLVLAARYRQPRIHVAVGFHPIHLIDAPRADDWQGLERLLDEPAVAAIGECGVDTVDGPASFGLQLDVLARQVELAVVRGLPLNLHLRCRHPTLELPEVLDLLARHGVPPRRAAIHYFVGDRALAQLYLDASLLISVGRPVTRAGETELRDAISLMPLDSILLETDTYPVVGRTTEPADVRGIAAAVAVLRAVTFDEVAGTTTRTFQEYLRLAATGGQARRQGTDAV